MGPIDADLPLNGRLAEDERPELPAGVELVVDTGLDVALGAVETIWETLG
jgi:hypothetical protein